MTLLRRPRRLVAAVLAVTLAVSAAPLLGLQTAQAADALPPPADPVASGAVCDGAPTDNPFTDLEGESASTREVILCLVGSGLTEGTSATTYTPAGTVTRRQMAVFIKRLADLLDELETGTAALEPLPEYDGTSDYSDVAADDPGATAIGQLSQADIVGGFADGTYRPNAPVSRRQMAAFVNRLQEFITGDPYATDNDYFTDDDGDSGEGNLNALASVGIFQGDGAGKVFPADSLTRRQMANILLRDAQVFFAADLIKTLFPAPFDVTPTTLATQEIATEPSATDDREYTASGLTEGITYTIQLYPAANVHGFTFTEDADTGTADEGAVEALITVVNDAEVESPAATATAEPVSGEITFTVDGEAIEAIVPVVYEDADEDGNLDLDDDNTPSAAEPFGVGGQIRYLPPEAEAGADDFEVTAVTLQRDAFTSADLTYFVDSNDTFQYQGAAITFAQFNSMLSVGDAGTTTYAPDPTGVSIFNITTDQVDAPEAPTFEVINGDAGATKNDARVTFAVPVANSPGVTYVLQRAVVTPLGPTPCGSPTDSAGTFATVLSATQAPGDPGEIVFSDNNVPDGCFTYRIRATSPVSTNTADSDAATAQVVPAA